jgi:hypothetical protein
MLCITQMIFMLHSVTLTVLLKKITIIWKCQQRGNNPCALGLFLFLEIKYMYIY